MLRHSFMVDDSPFGASYFDLLPTKTVFDMDGGDLAGAYKDAAQIQANAAEKAANTAFTMFQMGSNLVAPWREAGGTANAQIAGLLGLPGYNALDPTSTLQATPGYNWMMGQGVNALDRSAAARGMNMSGPQAKALTDYGQNLGLTKAWNPYMANLQSMSGQGLGAGTQTGQWATNTGQVMGQDYMAGANAQAQGLVNAAIAQQQQSGGLMSQIMSGLGLVGGLAMAPMTGGTSLFGSGLSGLSGLFGGGGGGGMGLSMPSMPNLSGETNWSAMYPRYAEGGAIPAGQPGIVGERGPEVFVPDQPGYIVPNSALTSSDSFYRTDRSPALNYFMKDWLRALPGSRMAYMEPPRRPGELGGWQPNPNDINYDVSRAYLFRDYPGMRGIQWDDVGPAGARWHGADRTPFGDYIKEPWSPERYGYFDEEAFAESALRGR